MIYIPTILPKKSLLSFNMNKHLKPTIHKKQIYHDLPTISPQKSPRFFRNRGHDDTTTDLAGLTYIYGRQSCDLRAMEPGETILPTARGRWTMAGHEKMVLSWRF